MSVCVALPAVEGSCAWHDGTHGLSWTRAMRSALSPFTTADLIFLSVVVLILLSVASVGVS